MKYISIILMSLFLVGNVNAKPNKKACKIVSKKLDESLEGYAGWITNKEWRAFEGTQNDWIWQLSIVYNATCK